MGQWQNSRTVGTRHGTKKKLSHQSTGNGSDDLRDHKAWDVIDSDPCEGRRQTTLLLDWQTTLMR